jgi:hypothetical protein
MPKSERITVAPTAFNLDANGPSSDKTTVHWCPLFKHSSLSASIILLAPYKSDELCKKRMFINYLIS